ncbi:hypothetical protein SL1157_A0004 [Ruegeria lacuscaerulensis ITI-1157]|nr:hypothetical protein SL1157_A0004 [Ruegeria lacuscaerulensis ITI-1157]SHJ80369.1 hypothetical protein SAMN05444404_2716 [Ruegeria lacuscaerulensis ITI-1157]
MLGAPLFSVTPNLLRQELGGTLQRLTKAPYENATECPKPLVWLPKGVEPQYRGGVT